MKILIPLLLFAPYIVNAGVYLDLSAEIHNETEDSFYQRAGGPIKNIIGTAEVGYEFETKTPVSVFLRHSSSMQQEDTGLNVIGLKFRVIGK